MFIALVIFAVIVVVSFILAILSMKNYQELPNINKIPYSAYLIKKEEALTENLLEELYKAISPGALILSFEQLFKGSRRALVVFGPSKILNKYAGILDLLELEDYSKKEADDNLLCSEISSKKLNLGGTDLLLKSAVSNLTETEELWWQIVLQPTSEGKGHLTLHQKTCKAIIRLVINSNEKARAKIIQEDVSRIIRDKNLIILPQAYSSSQILGFYNQRSLPESLLRGEEGAFEIDFTEVSEIIAQN